MIMTDKQDHLLLPLILVLMQETLMHSPHQRMCLHLLFLIQSFPTREIAEEQEQLLLLQPLRMSAPVFRSAEEMFQEFISEDQHPLPLHGRATRELFKQETGITEPGVL